MAKVQMKVLWSKISHHLETYIVSDGLRSISLLVVVRETGKTHLISPILSCVILLWRTALFIHKIGDTFMPVDAHVAMMLVQGFSEDQISGDAHESLGRIQSLVSRRSLKWILSKKIPPEIPEILFRLKEHCPLFDFADSFHTIPVAIGQGLMKWSRKFRLLELIPPTEYNLRKKRLTWIYLYFGEWLDQAKFDEEQKEMVLIGLIEYYDWFDEEIDPALVGASLVLCMIEELQARNWEAKTPQQLFAAKKREFVSAAAQSALKVYPNFCPKPKLERHISALVSKVFKQK